MFAKVLIITYLLIVYLCKRGEEASKSHPVFDRNTNNMECMYNSGAKKVNPEMQAFEVFFTANGDSVSIVPRKVRTQALQKCKK